MSSGAPAVATSATWQLVQAAVVPSDATLLSSPFSVGSGASRERSRLDINLGPVEYLMDFVLSDATMQRVDDMFARDAFGGQPFRVVVGDPGVEVAYLSSARLLASVARLLVEARNYERVVGLCVFRVVRDRARRIVHTLIDSDVAWREADDASGELPVAVERLTPRNGRLSFVKDRNGNTRWEYTPSDAEDARHFDYHVHVNPHRAFPDPITLRRQLAVLDPQLGPLLVAACSHTDTGMHGTRAGMGAGEQILLRSHFWEAVMLARHLHEATANIMDAEHMSTHPRAFYTSRTTRDVAPELLSADVLLRTQSVQQASAQEQSDVAMLNWQRGILFAKRFLTDHVPTGRGFGGRGFAGGEDGDVDSKRRLLRIAYGRPDVNDDAVLMPETIGQVSHSTPTWRLNPTEMRIEYAQVVARIMGGMPVSDVLAVYTGGPAGDPASSSRNRGHLDALHTQRQTVLRQERSAYSALFARVYALGFADMDMVGLSSAIERYTELQRRALGESLSRGAGASTREERRRLLYRAIGAQRTRRARPTDGETAGEGPAAPTVAELRAHLVRRLAHGELLEAELVFDADVEAEMRNEKRRDHEWLDAETHQARIKEVEMLGRLAAAGIIAPQSVVDAARNLLDLNCTVAQGDVFRAAMGIETPTAPVPLPKRPRTPSESEDPAPGARKKARRDPDE